MKALLSDPVVRLVFVTRVVALVGAPVTLLLVATLRPLAEQGFYFIFANVQAVAVLFEFGIGAMLVQFASHAGETGRASNEARDDESVLATLASARRWFATAAAIVVAVVLPGGFVLFGGEAYRTRIAYVGPWITLTIALGCYLTIIPSICVLEGTGKLRRVQQMRLAQGIIGLACLWMLIPVGGSLTAVASASVAVLLVAVIWLAVAFPRYLRPAARTRDAEHDAAMFFAHNRAAAGWIVGFLGPQLVAPIVFHYQGAAAAGQIGLSLAAANAPMMLSLSWLQARYPEYGRLVARNALRQLDAIAMRATAHAVSVCCLGVAGLLGIVVLLQRFRPALGARFLPIGGVAALSAAGVAYLLYQAMAGHLRAHREESLLWPMSVGTAATIAATVAGARRGAVEAAYAHSLAVLAVLFPLSVATFIRRRRVLHLAGRTPNEIVDG